MERPTYLFGSANGRGRELRRAAVQGGTWASIGEGEGCGSGDGGRRGVVAGSRALIGQVSCALTETPGTLRLIQVNNAPQQ